MLKIMSCTLLKMANLQQEKSMPSSKDTQHH